MTRKQAEKRVYDLEMVVIEHEHARIANLLRYATTVQVDEAKQQRMKARARLLAALTREMKWAP